jgi:hypothetical protein
MKTCTSFPGQFDCIALGAACQKEVPYAIDQPVQGTAAVAIAGLATSAAASSTTDGRWKIGGDGSCYFDDADSGPDQCLPPGRWRVANDGSCYFDAQDSGPDQCSADVSSAPESR